MRSTKKKEKEKKQSIVQSVDPGIGTDMYVESRMQEKAYKFGSFFFFLFFLLLVFSKRPLCISKSRYD